MTTAVKVSVSPGHTCLAKRTLNLRIASGPNQSFTTRAISPAVSMPWPNTDGFPTWVAIVSSWCIGLKSPDAPAYCTKWVRDRFSTTSGGRRVADAELCEGGHGRAPVSCARAIARHPRRKVTRCSLCPHAAPPPDSGARPGAPGAAGPGPADPASGSSTPASRCSPNAGYHAARVDDIVKVAETSHGTFYLYFANKEELFRVLAEGGGGRDRGAWPGRCRRSPPTRRRSPRSTSWLAAFADLYEPYGPVIRAWTEAEIVASELGRLGTDVLAAFTRVLVERIGDAASTGVDPVVAALALVAMIERATTTCGRTGRRRR